jgi:hypothetical protein
MRVRLFQQGSHWVVWLASEPNGRYPFEQFLRELEPSARAKVVSDLVEYVPDSLPAEWASSGFSKRLVGTTAVLEFRWPKGRGGTPRLLWFYADQRRLVLANGLIKKGSMPPVEVRRAETIRSRFLEAVTAGHLVEER